MVVESPNPALYDDLAMRLDPVAMVRKAGMEPDEWQAGLLRSQASRILLLCSRQSGKSTIAAALALYTALYEPGSPILLLSPSLRQSQELFRKCAWFYRALGRPVPAAAESALRLELEQGSRIISLPGNESTIRGISGVRLLIIDEAAWVGEDLYKAVRPMLAVSGGRLILLSTPFGARGFFYEAWRHRDEWDYYQIDATQCPRIAPEFLEEERRNLGEYYFQSEYMCQFLDTAASWFRSEDIFGMTAHASEGSIGWNIALPLE